MNVPSRNISGIKRSISPCEPSHHTILAGFVRRADSSTQLSNGVDTEPPWHLRGDTARSGSNSEGLAEQGRFPPKKVGHAFTKMQLDTPRARLCGPDFKLPPMYAQKLQSEVVI